MKAKRLLTALLAAVLVSGLFTLWAYVAFTPITPLRTNLIGGYNDSPATGPAAMYLAVGILACLIAAWWVGSDKFGYGIVPPQATRPDVEARETVSGSPSTESVVGLA